MWQKSRRCQSMERHSPAKHKYKNLFNPSLRKISRYVNDHYVSVRTGSLEEIRVRSRRCGCLVTWFCYQLIAKPGNKTTTPSWSNPYVAHHKGLVYHRGILSNIEWMLFEIRFSCALSISSTHDTILYMTVPQHNEAERMVLSSYLASMGNLIWKLVPSKPLQNNPIWQSFLINKKCLTTVN